MRVAIVIVFLVMLAPFNARAQQDQLFQRLDKNGDGMFSRDEATEIKAVGNRAPATSDNAKTNAESSAVMDFKPRLHRDEATKVGLQPEVLAKLDIALQQAVA